MHAGALGKRAAARRLVPVVLYMETVEDGFRAAALKQPAEAGTC
ncbi:hypothetical protein ACFORH_00395 [Amycolatopsis roodepoortensis]|uniref:Uncharacterized protein n=1 Tax=Amycolatopsis roodepoortensis TaxID=700274 RepID=A0ABR9L3Z5_9PSEU|nr:hypothetical protein [Amycolatopsis roodepoortensis]MBE1575449.1 hypothetical protein [Amycolatopsis roodepoortensis]